MDAGSTPEPGSSRQDTRPEQRAAVTMTAARTVAGLTMVSRILGLFREFVLASYFGTSTAVSAFRLAFMVPNLARRLFGEGALSAALIPVLTETLSARGEAPSQRLIGALTVRVGLLLAGVVILAEIGLVIARSYTSDPVFDFAVVLLPYMPLICLVALNCGVLQVRRQFALPAALPVLLNVGMIGAIYLGDRVWHANQTQLLYFASGGVLVSVALQFAITAVAMHRQSLPPRFTGPAPSDALNKVSTMMGGAAIGLSAVQINSLFDYVIAYTFVEVDGERVGPAVLATAHFLYQLPLGVFGIAIATAIFPSLSLLATRRDEPGFLQELGRGLRTSMIIAFPSTVGLLFIADPLVETLFEHGEFTSDSTTRVAGALMFYALGLPAYFANHVLTRAYYAHQDSRKPARIAVITVAINVVLNLILVQSMEESGLALATAICASLQTLALWRYLPVKHSRGGFLAPIIGLVRPLLATGVMTAALLSLYYIPFAYNILLSAGWTATVLMLLTGVITYLVAARIFCAAEFKMLTGRNQQKTM